jgi:hypothetical protein
MSPLVRKAEDAAQATIGKADDLPCLAELLVFLERAS